MSFLSSKKNIQILLVVVGVLFLSAYFLNFFRFEETREFRRSSISEIITYEGLPEDMEISAMLDMNGTVSTLDARDGKFSLNMEQRANFRLPYKIEATIKGPSGDYRDMSWKVEENGKDYFVLADGFSPDDTITLNMNDDKIYEIPFDWSGRIELPIQLIIKSDTKTCIDIKTQPKTITFCHFTAGQKI